MFFEPILTFFLVLYLRKTLRTFSPILKWDKVLTRVLFGIVLLLIIQITLSAGPVIIWIWHLALLLIIVTTFRRPELFHARNVMFAVMPFAFIVIFSEIAKTLGNDFYKTIDNYIGYTYPVAVTWMIAMLIISRKQRRALEKERKIRLEEEEQNKIVAARKAELEILVAERTAELTQQKEELEHALSDLKSTQAQLVQREKMASLGELTAGIAHEIQNPLNFVNNFSEVSAELIDEWKEELSKGNGKEAIAIANNVKQNLEKIIHHGKRADAIVRGMLQHSRVSTGQKELTDINALTDEYLRLSYHGLRAKDKTFNATLETDFDMGIEKINVVAQDIGRVLLNLFNNAFYAVGEKKKNLTGLNNYEPIVSVSTKRINYHLDAVGIEIRIKDNGVGMSQKVVDKIFQPFFTTKPTGQGTGLGLSLSYDIIKVHGGEIKVKTKEGEGSEFIIQLSL
jgi:two-component system NtrC family sensor kinase